MKLNRPTPRAARCAPAAAFTMVEIALALAVIGFALVAVIGVLPTGLEVQKNNRRETIINQDAQYLIEAIRGGARGIDDLTNYVISINNHWTFYRANGTVASSGVDSYTNAQADLPGQANYLLWPDTNFRVTSLNPNIQDFRLTNGLRTIGVLSTPKYRPVANGFISNYVVAYVRAISGAAMEKFPQNNEIIQEAAFAYRLVTEVTPFSSWGYTNAYADPRANYLGLFYPGWTNFAASDVISNNVSANVICWMNAWALLLAANRHVNPDPVLFYLESTTNKTPLGIPCGSVDLADINLPEFRARASQWLLTRNVQPNLSDLRLVFRWPVLPGNRLGNGRQSYRVMIGGAVTNEPPGGPTYYLRPQSYVRP